MQEIIIKYFGNNEKSINKLFKWVLSFGIVVSRMETDICILNTKRLENKRLLITGGGKSLGFSMAKKCIEEGATVVVCGRNKETLEQSAKSLGIKCNCLVYDISDTSETNAFIDKCVSV